jgi:superfamily II DNA or RNA helicase
MIRIIVDAQLRLQLGELSDEVLRELLAGFTHSNPVYHKLKRINRRAARGKSEFISTFDMTDTELLLPRGGSQQLRQVLHSNSEQFSFDDSRSEGDPLLVPSGFPKHLPGGEEHPEWELWEHQQQVVDAVLRRENCLIRAPTGSGKTSAALAAIAAAGKPALVVMWNGRLYKQWLRRIGKELPGIEPGMIRAKQFKLGAVTVAMQQTLWRLPDEKWRQIERSFGTICCDEVQRFAARSFLDVVHRVPARFRIGISADESRKDKCEFLIYDEFGEVECEISQDQLIALGIVHDVEVRVLPTEFRAGWYAEQRKAVAEALSKGRDIRPPEYKRLIDAMTADDKRCRLALQIAQSSINEGRQVIMLSERVDHCKRLQSLGAGYGLKSRLALGGEYEQQCEEALAQLVSGDLRFAIGTIQAIGCGVDLPSVDRGIVTTPMHSNRQQWGQLRGRLCRTAEGKRGAMIYYLWDRHVFGTKPLEALHSWNRKVSVLRGGKWISAKEALRHEAE